MGLKAKWLGGKRLHDNLCKNFTHVIYSAISIYIHSWLVTLPNQNINPWSMECVSLLPWTNDYNTQHKLQLHLHTPTNVRKSWKLSQERAQVQESGLMPFGSHQLNMNSIVL